MSKIGNAISEIHRMDQLAERDQWVNRIHPLVKFVLTIAYIAIVVSFHKYDIYGIAGMAIYPYLMYTIADLSWKDSFKRLKIVLPLVCFIGIFNPIFDRTIVTLGDMQIRAGVLSMLTLMMKGVFSVLASYLLIATTSIDKICYALDLLHVPKIMITQFMLTYRYVTVLLEEVNRITQAYALRAPKQKGIHYRVWGSLTGQLLLRSMDRATVVYESMTLRGFQGNYRYLGKKIKWSWKDGLYMLIWLVLFVVLRKIPVILVIGNYVGGLFV